MSAFDLASSRDRKSLLAEGLVILAATAIALVGAPRHASSWNDGSRLATVECLVDRHTFAIDESVFVAVPPVDDPVRRSPYAAYDPDLTRLLQGGTGDKIFVEGHYYSDKSPVPALLDGASLLARPRCGGLTKASRSSLP